MTEERGTSTPITGASGEGNVVPFNREVFQDVVIHYLVRGFENFAAFWIYISFWFFTVYAAVEYIQMPDLAVFALLFFLSGTVVGLLKVGKNLYDVCRFLFRNFTPPYGDSHLDFELPHKENLVGRRQYPSVASISGELGLFYLCLVVIWLLGIRVLVELVGMPYDVLTDTLRLLPESVTEAFINTAVNVTGIDLITLLSALSPGWVDFLIVLGPVFLLGTIASWNFIYALREWISASSE